MGTVKEKYGFLPTSVLHFGKTKSLTRGFLDNQKLRKTKTDNSSSSSMSEFNPDLCKFVIQCWSNKYDLIVDPYHGWGTRAVISKQLMRNYIGFDISPETNDNVKKLLKINNEQSKWFETEKTNVNVICGDGIKLLNIKDDSADFVFSCPPYFNIEKYENVPNQLSNITDYDVFLELMFSAAQRQYTILKNNKYCVMVVGDWRVNGELLMFSQDMIRAYLNAGFLMHDFIIHKLNSMAVIGCGSFDNNNFVTKSHEYVLVFKKNTNKKTINSINKTTKNQTKLTDEYKWVKNNYGNISEELAKKLIKHKFGE